MSYFTEIYLNMKKKIQITKNHNIKLEEDIKISVILHHIRIPYHFGICFLEHIKRNFYFRQTSTLLLLRK